MITSSIGPHCGNGAKRWRRHEAASRRGGTTISCVVGGSLSVTGEAFRSIAFLIVCLVTMLMLRDSQAAPVIKATKTDQLFIDNNLNGTPDSGDTLKYTVVITNLGTTDALGVLFSDLLDTNTTLIPGSVMTTPLALDDAYSAIGNIQISIAAPGVLANDVDPDGVGPALTVTPFTGVSANGGNVTLSANGSFTYNPPPGFEGTDTFTYILNDNDAPNSTSTGTVSIAVSGMIWFVNSAAGGGGDGRLTSPFNALTGAGSFNSVAADDPGDNIFLYSGSYAGGLTLLNNQKLIGQGAAASLTAITGLTPPPGSLALPATGGNRPTLSASVNNIVLSSGNQVRGLNLNSTGGTALLGTGVGTLTVSEASVTNTSGTAVNLANGTLTANFTSVSANAGANGIKLVNTTGSFLLAGTGAPGSGGFIQNTTGADGSTDGCGVYLNNATNVSLAFLGLSAHPNFAIRGITVTGFTFTNSTIGGINGNNAAFDEGSVSFSDLLGSALISGCVISGGLEDNVRVANANGTLNRLTMQNTTIGPNGAALGDDGMFVEASSSAVLNVTVTNCIFTSARGDLLQCNALNNSVMNWVIVRNAFSNSHPAIVSGGGGTTFSGGGAGSAVTVTYNISGNSFRDAQGIALNVFKGTGGGSFSGTISNNTIGVTGVVGSGSAQASGIQINSSGTGTHTTRIENNTILRYNENGIYVRANDGNSAINASILNNLVAQPDVFGLNGLQLNVGGTATDANFACADIRNNTLAGSGPFAGDDFNLRQRFLTTLKLPGYAGAVNNTAAVIAFVQANNFGPPDGSATVSGSGGGFVGGTPCVLPLLAASGGVESAALATVAIQPPPAGLLPSTEIPIASVEIARGAASVLDEPALNKIIAAAKQRWQQAGLTEQQLVAINRTKFELTEIGGWCLGSSSEGLVQLDRKAAGRGWFIDPTPLDDTEFADPVSDTRAYAKSHDGPAGRIDLLTTVMHEMGHIAGLTDANETGSGDDLMHGSLTVGERRLPSPGRAASGIPGNIKRTQFVFTPISIGTLPPGKSITITFQVTINSPLPGGVCQLANQGTVSGSNFSSVLTDDPDFGGANDPTITVLATLLPPTITAVPANVGANTSGNQASAPAGYAAYAWTIGNGTFTSPANQPIVTYTAGPSGSVTLGLTVFNASGCSAVTSANVAIVVPPTPVIISEGCSFRTNYFAGLTFSNAPMPYTTMPIAFDGTNYWSTHGGVSGATNLARYNASGVLLARYAVNLDLRSVFTDPSGGLYARAYANPKIYRQTSPGVFVDSGVTLTGSTLDNQSSVVLNGAATEYIAMNAGVVSRWSTNGAYLGSVNLLGFGSIASENTFPQNRGLAAAGGFWLTYNGGGILSIWDAAGNRLLQSTLSGAGVSSDSSFSFSYCNDKVFIVDVATGLWRGFDVCAAEPAADRTAIFAAEANANWNADVQSKILGAGLFSQVDLIRVDGANPIPTLSDLLRYRSVLVYSDPGFSNNTNMGNVLADYVDQGRGVALATFVFWNSGALSLQGRLVTGNYLPFTTGGQSQGSPLTLLKDLPAHPILTNVNSLDGGTSSYHNSPIGVAAGATLVAHWNNGQPLVGTKLPTMGRVVGLNFFPPSSDAASGLWLANTDGARLMANALLWAGAGQALPAIVTNPVSQIGAVGSFVTFTVSASGTPPLSYQWRRDGINLPGQTSDSLTVEVQPANIGNYSVVVSNTYGVAFSASASLGSRLRFLPLSPPVAGILPLIIGSSDNYPLSAERAARIRVYATTNIALPFTSWDLTSNPLVLSNGYLRVNGVGTTNPPTRFFRALETP